LNGARWTPRLRSSFGGCALRHKDINAGGGVERRILKRHGLATGLLASSWRSRAKRPRRAERCGGLPRALFIGKRMFRQRLLVAISLRSPAAERRIGGDFHSPVLLAQSTSPSVVCNTASSGIPFWAADVNRPPRLSPALAGGRRRCAACGASSSAHGILVAHHHGLPVDILLNIRRAELYICTYLSSLPGFCTAGQTPSLTRQIVVCFSRHAAAAFWWMLALDCA